VGVKIPRRLFVHWTATLVAIAGVGLLIYWEQTARPLWVDEEMLVLNARDRAFTRFDGPLWLDQSAPPGWLALERIALLTLGTGERAVRLVTVLFGIATLVTAVWVGRRSMGPAGATVLVLLCSIGEWIVFFTLELKHYSADTFGALLLPALGARALETADGSNRLTRRITLWWMAAAILLWFSYGALFVTPACAAVLFVECSRRNWRSAGWMAIVGFVWLCSFGLYYVLVLRHTLGNAYLQNYWAFAFPPRAGGARAILDWSIARLEPFAKKPGGSQLWVLFWLTSVSGIAYATATRRMLGPLLAAVPISALALAILHLVPPFERLALWVVPALYVGVGFCADAAVRLGGHTFSRRRPIPLVFAAVAAAAAAAAAGAVCADLVRHGVLALVNRPRSNYGLDDRRSVRWLMAARRPGDVVMTTHFGLAALWWYGGLDISNADRSGHLLDGTPILEMQYVPSEADCSRADLETTAALRGHQRALVYLGFRLNVLPPGFDNLALEDLGRHGALVGYQRYAEESRGAVFDLGRAPVGRLVIPAEPVRPAGPTAGAGGIDPHPPAQEGQSVLTGCLSLVPARRW
jgi:hypothetical protein